MECIYVCWSRSIVHKWPSATSVFLDYWRVKVLMQEALSKAERRKEQVPTCIGDDYDEIREGWTGMRASLTWLIVEPWNHFSLRAIRCVTCGSCCNGRLRQGFLRERWFRLV